MLRRSIPDLGGSAALLAASCGLWQCCSTRGHRKPLHAATTPPLPSSASGTSPPLPLPPDPLLAPFLGDYRPGAWYTKHADLGLTLTLSLLSALLPRPASLPLAVTKACISAAYALALAAHALLARPYLPGDAWKGWVRALLLTVTAGCAVSSALATAARLG